MKKQLIIKNKIIALALASLLAFGCVYAGNSDSGVQSLLQQAEQLTKSNQAEESIRIYKDLLNKNLTNEEKRRTEIELAHAYVVTNQFPLALSLYDQLLSANPRDCEVRKIVGDLYLSFAQYDAKNNKHQSAINWYVSTMALDPRKRAALLREYADEVSKGGNGPVAVVLYKEIIADKNRTPSDIRLANLGLAQTYVWLNNHKEALEIYDNLLKNNPNDKEARKGKAAIYIAYARFDASQGNHAKAIEWFRKALEIDPDERAIFLKELADQLSYNSQLDEAIVLYKEILNNKPETDVEREIRLSLARVYIEKFLYEDALKEYENLLTQNKYDARAKQGKAKVYVDYAAYNSRLGKHREAIEWYYKALENDPVIRPELLQKIESERSMLGSQDIPPKSQYELDIEACFENEKNNLSIEDHLKQAKESPVFVQHTKEIEHFKKTSNESSKVIQKELPKPQPALSLAKNAFDSAQNHAKYLQVFEANRDFEASLARDPQNKSYRESYAWHLQTFSFIPEAVYQLEILLPNESDKTPFYEAFGWDYRRLGLLEESIWAFSNLYCIPCNLMLNNQYIIANHSFHNVYEAKIDELWASLACADETQALEIKKKIFEYATYIGELEIASTLACEILSEHPEEYLVQYRYAILLHQKKKYTQAAIQFQILLEKLPCNAFLYLSLGRVLEEMGCIFAAETAYQNALLFDRNPETERAYARILAKLGDCETASEITNQIASSEENRLTGILSNAEVDLNCGCPEEAAAIYRSVLDEYPFNQDALWGLLKSSTYTRNSHDALVAYRRWPYVWFEEPLQNFLANYYRPPELTLPSEYYYDSTTFRRFAVGLNLSEYACNNMRFFARSYFTQFSEEHFDTINRQSIYLGVDKLINRHWEFHAGVVENYYKPLQHKSEDRYSKAVTNCHLHLAYHKLNEFSADIGYDYYDVIDTIPPFNNPIYNYSSQIGAASLNIRTSDLNLFLNYNKDKIYWFANVVIGRYSDGNVKTTQSYRIGYRFCDLPENYIYYSYFYLNFNERAPLFHQNGHVESAYYDPKNLEIHSIGITSKYDATEKLQIGGETALLYLPKVANFGYSGFGYFNYQLSDRWSCRLDLRFYYQTKGVTRTGTTGYFYAENASFQINYIY